METQSPSTKQLVAEAQALLKKHPGSAAGANPQTHELITQSEELLKRHRGGRRGLWVILIVVLAIAGGAAVFFLR